MTYINTKLAYEIYPAVVWQTSLGDGTPWFMAEHPALPGCMSDGLTPEEALANLEDARAEYIASLREDGLPVPPPAVPAATLTLGSASAAAWAGPVIRFGGSTPTNAKAPTAGLRSAD